MCMIIFRDVHVLPFDDDMDINNNNNNNLFLI